MCLPETPEQLVALDDALKALAASPSARAGSWSCAISAA